MTPGRAIAAKVARADRMSARYLAAHANPEDAFYRAWVEDGGSEREAALYARLRTEPRNILSPCKECGTPIYGRAPNAIFCLPCADDRRAAAVKRADRKRTLAKRKEG